MSSSSDWGGGRAGLSAGRSVGSPRWARILVTTGGSSMVAMKRRRPPQLAHAKTSIEKTLRIKSAHAQACRVRLAVGDGAEVGCAGVGESTCDRSRELAVGGGDDGSIAAAVAPGTVGSDGEREGASDVGIGDTIDGALGGVIVGAADDAGGRHRARGAKTPW